MSSTVVSASGPVTWALTSRRRAARMARRMRRRSTYPRPSLDGSTPSAINIVMARPWSASRRMAMSVASSAP